MREGLSYNELKGFRSAHNSLTDEEFEELAGDDTGEPTPLTPVPTASGALPKNIRQGGGALQAFEVGCGVPVGGLQADYEASARLPKTDTRNLLDGHSSWWRLRAEAVISYLKMPFWRALVG